MYSPPRPQTLQKPLSDADGLQLEQTEYVCSVPLWGLGGFLMLVRSAIIPFPCCKLFLLFLPPHNTATSREQQHWLKLYSMETGAGWQKFIPLGGVFIFALILDHLHVKSTRPLYVLHGRGKTPPLPLPMG